MNDSNAQAELTAELLEIESESEPAPLRLNLGAGALPLEGYQNLDGARKESIYPLTYVACVDEIRASHVLEHFGHHAVIEVLKNWAGALKPGGVLKIAVPNFHTIAQQYLDGVCIDVQGYVMGGQTNKLDFHRAIFDEDELRNALHAAGLRGVRHWVSELQDCAALPISLNLQGTKPLAVRPKTAAVLSLPRLGFMNNAKALLMLPAMGVPVHKAMGAYWGSTLTRALLQVLDEYQPEYVLTLDYDTLFAQDHVDALLETAARNPHVDALAALQINRSNGKPLFWVKGPDGETRREIRTDEMQAELVPVHRAHFGLTLLRAASLRALPHPWFYGNPGASGQWGDDRIDDDIAFWDRWQAAGFSLYLAARVPIGHLVERALWPDFNLEPIYQDPSEFWSTGAPAEVWK